MHQGQSLVSDALDTAALRGVDHTRPVLVRDAAATLHGVGVLGRDTGLAGELGLARPERHQVSNGVTLKSHDFVSTLRRHSGQLPNVDNRPLASPAMAKTTRGERLRQARKARFPELSGREAAEALGISRSTLNAHERAGAPGARDYGADEAESYGRRLGVRPEWLLTGRGPAPRDDDDLDKPPEPRTEIVGYVGAGANAHFYNVSQGSLDDVPRPSFATDKTVAVEIRGDSLGKWVDRWLVYYDDVHSPITEDMFGRTCVLGLANDQVVIKVLKPGSRKGVYDLVAEKDSETIKDAKVLWGAKVKMIAQR